MRFLFVATRPNKGFQISFDNDVIKLYEDFDVLEEKYYSGDLDEQEKRYYELSVIKPAKKKPERVSFRHLITLVQAGEKVSGTRVNKVKNWLDKYAGGDMKFEIQDNVDVNLNEKERKVLVELRELLGRSLSEKELENEIYEICKNNCFEIKDFFKLAYGVILNKERGPRLAGLILNCKSKIVKLLGQIK